MRSISAQLRSYINNGAHFVFGFEIELIVGKKLYLTNFSNAITVNGIVYLPNSALQIVKANFNDSAHDFVEVSGIFDDAAINTFETIQDAKVNISIIVPQHQLVEQLLALYCFSIQKHNLQFTLYLKNNITKLGQNVTKIYSKTCRARLGDAKCGVNLENLGTTIKVLHISTNIVVASINAPSSYYDYGKVRFENGLEMLILKQNVASLILENNVPFDLQKADRIKIFPGCDKTHETCYNKFKNTLNFRGEPFVPEFNYEKVF